MALIPCSECNHTISSEAEACPNCGKRLYRSRWETGGIFISTITLTTQIISALIGSVAITFGLQGLISSYQRNNSEDGGLAAGLGSTGGYFTIIGVLIFLFLLLYIIMRMAQKIPNE